MKSFPSIALCLFATLAGAATSSTNTTLVACQRDLSQVCCTASRSSNGQTSATNVCCRGSVVGSGNTDHSTNLLEIYDGLTCCQGDSANAVLTAATCTAGSPVSMRSIAASQGVGGMTLTSLGLGYKATGAPLMVSAAMLGGACAIAVGAL